MADNNGISKDAHREGEKTAPSRSLSYKVGSGCAAAFLWFLGVVVFFGVPMTIFGGFWLHLLKRCFEFGWGLV